MSDDTNTELAEFNVAMKSRSPGRSTPASLTSSTISSGPASRAEGGKEQEAVKSGKGKIAKTPIHPAEMATQGDFVGPKGLLVDSLGIKLRLKHADKL